MSSPSSVWSHDFASEKALNLLHYYNNATEESEEELDDKEEIAMRCSATIRSADTELYNLLEKHSALSMWAVPLAAHRIFSLQKLANEMFAPRGQLRGKMGVPPISDSFWEQAREELETIGFLDDVELVDFRSKIFYNWVGGIRRHLGSLVALREKTYQELVLLLAEIGVPKHDSDAWDTLIGLWSQKNGYSDVRSVLRKRSLPLHLADALQRYDVCKISNLEADVFEELRDKYGLTESQKSIFSKMYEEECPAFHETKLREAAKLSKRKEIVDSVLLQSRELYSGIITKVISEEDVANTMEKLKQEIKFLYLPHPLFHRDDKHSSLSDILNNAVDELSAVSIALDAARKFASRGSTLSEVIENVSTWQLLDGITIGLSGNPGSKPNCRFLSAPKYIQMCSPLLSTSVFKEEFKGQTDAVQFRSSLATMGMQLALSHKASAKENGSEDSGSHRESCAVRQEHYFVPMMSFKLEEHQLVMSTEAVDRARQITTKTMAKRYLKDFYPFVSCGVHHVGGIQTSTVFVRSDYQRATYTMDGKANSYSELRTGGTSVEAYSNGSLQDNCGENIFHCFGTEAQDRESFAGGLANDMSTWRLIDRGEKTSIVPVWTVMMRHNERMIQTAGKMVLQEWLKLAADYSFNTELSMALKQRAAEDLQDFEVLQSSLILPFQLPMRINAEDDIDQAGNEVYTRRVATTLNNWISLQCVGNHSVSSFSSHLSRILGEIKRVAAKMPLSQTLWGELLKLQALPSCLRACAAEVDPTCAYRTGISSTLKLYLTSENQDAIREKYHHADEVLEDPGIRALLDAEEKEGNYYRGDAPEFFKTSKELLEQICIFAEENKPLHERSERIGKLLAWNLDGGRITRFELDENERLIRDRIYSTLHKDYDLLRNGFQNGLDTEEVLTDFLIPDIKQLVHKTVTTKGDAQILRSDGHFNLPDEWNSRSWAMDAKFSTYFELRTDRYVPPVPSQGNGRAWMEAALLHNLELDVRVQGSGNGAHTNPRQSRRRQRSIVPASPLFSYLSFLEIIDTEDYCGKANIIRLLFNRHYMAPMCYHINAHDETNWTPTCSMETVAFARPEPLIPICPALDMNLLRIGFSSKRKQRTSVLPGLIRDSIFCHSLTQSCHVPEDVGVIEVGVGLLPQDPELGPERSCDDSAVGGCDSQSVPVSEAADEKRREQVYNDNCLCFFEVSSGPDFMKFIVPNVHVLVIELADAANAEDIIEELTAAVRETSSALNTILLWQPTVDACDYISQGTLDGSETEWFLISGGPTTAADHFVWELNSILLEENAELRVRNRVCEPIASKVLYSDCRALNTIYGEDVTENISVALKKFDVTSFRSDELRLQCEFRNKIAATRDRIRAIQGAQSRTIAKRRQAQAERMMRRHLYAGAPESNLLLRQFVTLAAQVDPVSRIGALRLFQQELDGVAKPRINELKEEIDATRNQLNKNPTDVHLIRQLKSLQERLLESSVSVEHLWRELSHMYSTLPERYYQFPRMAAMHLLDGFQLELVDGDAGAMNNSWMGQVLKELDALLMAKSKLVESPKVLILSILGCQSSGKSTLLSVMFGCDIKTSVRRCTRGINMQIIRVDRPECDYDYVLVLDSEGVRAPELKHMPDALAHDNRLAMYCMWVSDMTIVMINHTQHGEICDILSLTSVFAKKSSSLGTTHGRLRSRLSFVMRSVSQEEGTSATSELREAIMGRLRSYRFGTTEDSEGSIPNIQTQPCISEMLSGFNMNEDIVVLGSHREEFPKDVPAAQFGMSVLRMRDRLHCRLASSGTWKPRTMAEWWVMASKLTDDVNSLEQVLNVQNSDAVDKKERLDKHVANCHQFVCMHFEEAYKQIERQICTGVPKEWESAAEASVREWVDQRTRVGDIISDQATKVKKTEKLIDLAFDKLETVKIEMEPRKIGDDEAPPEQIATTVIDAIGSQKSSLQSFLSAREYSDCRDWQIQEWDSRIKRRKAQYRQLLRDLICHKELKIVEVNRAKDRILEAIGRLAGKYSPEVRKSWGKERLQREFSMLFQEVCDTFAAQYEPLAVSVEGYIRGIFHIYAPDGNMDVELPEHDRGDKGAACAYREDRRLAKIWKVLKAAVGFNASERKGVIIAELVTDVESAMDALTSDVAQYSEDIVLKGIRKVEALLEEQQIARPAVRQAAFGVARTRLVKNLTQKQEKWDKENSVALLLEHERNSLWTYFVGAMKEQACSERLGEYVGEAFAEDLRDALIEYAKYLTVNYIRENMDQFEWITNAKVLQAHVDLKLLDAYLSSKEDDGTLRCMLQDPFSQYEDVMKEKLQEVVAKNTTAIWECGSKGLHAKLTSSIMDSVAHLEGTDCVDTKAQQFLATLATKLGPGARVLGEKLPTDMHIQSMFTMVEASQINLRTVAETALRKLPPGNRRGYFEILDEHVLPRKLSAAQLKDLQIKFNSDIIEVVYMRLAVHDALRRRCDSLCHVCQLACSHPGGIGHDGDHDCPHQPSGLSGVCFVGTRVLCATSCVSAARKGISFHFDGPDQPATPLTEMASKCPRWANPSTETNIRLKVRELIFRNKQDLLLTLNPGTKRNENIPGDYNHDPETLRSELLAIIGSQK